MGLFQTLPAASLSATAHTAVHGLDRTQILQIQITDHRMVGMLFQMGNLLNITNTCQDLFEKRHTNVGNITGENHPIFQAPIDIVGYRYFHHQ